MVHPFWVSNLHHCLVAPSAEEAKDAERSRVKKKFIHKSCGILMVPNVSKDENKTKITGFTASLGRESHLAVAGAAVEDV